MALPQPENFTLTTSDNIDLAVSRWQPEVEPIAKVVLAHGFRASREREEIKILTQALVAMGADLTMHDARGHGESGGHTTIGGDEQHDIEAVVAHASQQNSAAQLPLVLIGISMGAIASVTHLAANPENHVDALMLVSSPAYWRPRTGTSSATLYFLSRTWLGRELAKRRSGVRIAPKFSLPDAPADSIASVEMPVGIIGGTQDLLLGSKAPEQLYQAANEPKKLALVQGGGHSLCENGIKVCQDMLVWLSDSAELPQA